VVQELPPDPQGEVLLYTTDDEQVSLDVRVESSTVWLTYQQMADLFDRDQSVIARHARNALAEGEVASTSFGQNLPKTLGGRPTQVADLDVIISVGYRVKSLRGVQFRRWATGVLRKHIVQGYTLNQPRLDQLNQALEIISRSSLPEVAGVARVLQNYADGLTLLDDYDHQRVEKPKGQPGASTRGSTVRSSTPASRRRRPTSSTLSSRTTPSSTATSASPPDCSRTSSTRTRS